MVLSFAAQESRDVGQRRIDSGCDRFTRTNRQIIRTEDFAMLVLSRKVNEKIMIGNDIVITIVKIDRNQIRIGIEAPGHVPVYREEILPVSWHADKEESATVAVSV
jgi:carbon storage regulator